MIDLSDTHTAIRNPFDSERARANSCYLGLKDGLLVRIDGDGQPLKVPSSLHDAFRHMVLGESFPCVGARSAVRRATYRFAVYDRMGSKDATAGLARDLFTFTQERARWDAEFSTFFAAFAAPTPLDERQFEGLLWTQLEQLSELDRRYHRWAPSVSADPRDPAFAYSFAERPFFVVGLHPHSSRLARRFIWPALVFNSHEQFDRLRERGGYHRMRDTIRARDRSLQGSINPMAGDFGERSEARQYAGRAVGDDWQCPFHAEPGVRTND